MNLFKKIRNQESNFFSFSTIWIALLALIVFQNKDYEEYLDSHADNPESAIFSTMPPAALSCKTNVNVSISETGISEIIPEFFVQPGYPNIGDLVLTIQGRADNFVYCDDVGHSFMYTLHNPITNETCMGSFNVEDKLPPVFECITKEVPCGIDIYNIQPPYAELVTVVDNCTNPPTVSILSHTERYYHCPSPYTFEIVRTYRATDAWGNSSTCQDTVRFLRPIVDSIVFPADLTMSCDVFNSDTSVTGEPTFMGYPLRGVCYTWFGYNDQTIPMGCAGKFKIRRTWTVMDECNNSLASHVQNIMSIDTTAPVVTCPADQTIPTNDNECTVFYTFPAIDVTDNCSSPGDFTFQYKVDDVIVFASGKLLTKGTHTIEVLVNDGCNNTASCSYQVTVADQQAPNLVCHDIVVGLNNQGIGTVCADTLGFDYFDNCDGPLTVRVRKMDNPDFTSCVTYTCDELGSDNMLVFEVCDSDGNCNTCMVVVTVQDLEPPVFTNCPTGPIAISCFDAAVLDPADYEPDATDNCGIASVTNEVTSNLNCNHEGTIVIVYTAFDEVGNSAVCTVNLNVFNPDTLSASDITWPADISMGGCNPDLSDTAQTGYPSIIGEFCNDLWIGGEIVDTTYNDDGCAVYTLRWVVADFCIFDLSNGDLGYYTHDQYITVQGATPPILTIPADITATPDNADCSATVDLDSVFAAGCGEPIIITNDYNDQGANLDGIYPYGTTVIVITAENVCGLTTSDTLSITVEYGDDFEGLTCPGDYEVSCLDYDPADFPVPTINIICDGYTLTHEITSGTLNDCGTGTLEVTWTLNGPFDIHFTCSYNVTVIPGPGLQEDEITWPADVTMTECFADVTDTAVIGYPVISGIYCNTMDIDFALTDSTQSQDGCREYLITWTITDACLFETSGGSAGVYSHIQHVTVTGSAAPLLTVPADITVVPNNDDCSATVDLDPALAFGCGEPIQIINSFNNGGANADGDYPYGVNLVIFTATNVCGLQTIDTTIVTVAYPDDFEVLTCPDNQTYTCLEFDVDNIPAPVVNIICIDYTLERNIIGSLDACGTGVLTVVDSLWTNFGLNYSCSFTVVVGLSDTLSPADIVWPADIADGGCSIDLSDTTETGYPVIDGEFCQVLDIGFVVQDTTYNVDGCAVLHLLWTVADSCLWEATGGAEGIYTHSQDITIFGATSPNLTIPDDITVTPNNDDCSATIDFDNAIATGCGVITIFNSYNDGGANLDDEFPIGVTTVIFTAENECGNITQDSLIVTVTFPTDDLIICRTDTSIACVDFDINEIPGVEFINLCGTWEIDTLITGDLNACGVGVLGVTYTITTGDGRSDSCSFNINVNNTSVLDSSDIEWPVSPLLVDCTISIHPDSINSFPIISNDMLCNNITSTYTDEPTDPTVDEACTAVNRTWVVTDSCSTDGNGGLLQFFFTQIINVIDTTPPVFDGYENFDTITLSVPINDCKVPVNIYELIEFVDCSEIIDVEVLNIDPATPIESDSLVLFLPGSYSVEFGAEDACGNIAELTIIVEIVDGHPPTWNCPDSLEVDMDPSGIMTIHAKDFNYGTFLALDNCTFPHNMRFSFDSLDLTDTLMQVVCSGTPGGFVIEDIQVWAFDEVGFSVSCFIDLIVNVPAGTDCSHSMMVFGTVSSELSEPMSGVEIYDDGAQNMMLSSDASGSFVIDNLPQGQDLLLRGVMDDAPMSGVNTQDIIAMRDHLLGKKYLGSPYKLLAGDVNQDNRMSVRDILEIRKLILGITDEFSAGQTWKFADRAYEFTNPENPFSQPQVFTKKIDYIEGSIAKADFLGIKLGDVNNTVKVNAQQKGMEIRDGQSMYIMANVDLDGEDVVKVVLTASELNKYKGFQFELAYNMNELELVTFQAGNLTDFDESNVALNTRNNGRIGFSWDEIGKNHGTEIGTLIFRAKSDLNSGLDLRINSDRIEAASYTDGGRIDEISLLIDGKPTRTVSAAGKLLQNAPNPFSHFTTISVELTEETQGRLVIYDVTGKEVWSQSMKYAKGMNKVEISTTNLTGSGVYYYKFESVSFTDTKKMILTL